MFFLHNLSQDLQYYIFINKTKSMNCQFFILSRTLYFPAILILIQKIKNVRIIN
jgi:hypothetical protein